MTDQEFLVQLQLSIDLRAAGDLQHALRSADELALIRPDQAATWHNLAQCQTEYGRFSSALNSSKRATEIIFSNKPDGEALSKEEKDVLFGHSCALLRFGDWNWSSWFFWEVGRKGISWSPLPGCKHWLGAMGASDLPAIEQPERLLIQCEGGYGDVFLFLRWLPGLKQWSGSGKLGVMVWPELGRDIIDWASLGVDEVLHIGEEFKIGDWTHSTSMMSLPSVHGVTKVQDIPETPSARTIFKDFQPSTALPTNYFKRVGFCWRSEESGSPRKIRSLPQKVAEEIAEELEQSDPKIVIRSLSPMGKDLYPQQQQQQPEPAVDQTGAVSAVSAVGVDSTLSIQPPPTAAWMQYGGQYMTDWRETARYILSMDFVITVDTAVAHLTGLLGVPALLLLPVASDWKWGIVRDYMLRSNIKWYDSSAIQTYFQDSPFSWEVNGIVRKVIERLKETGGDE